MCRCVLLLLWRLKLLDEINSLTPIKWLQKFQTIYVNISIVPTLIFPMYILSLGPPLPVFPSKYDCLHVPISLSLGGTTLSTFSLSLSRYALFFLCSFLSLWYFHADGFIKYCKNNVFKSVDSNAQVLISFLTYNWFISLAWAICLVLIYFFIVILFVIL